ncbi:hypothetical protein FFJ24_010365 [Pedobacter sp. KBS0701]|uniref:hypothetical protein n=1 Tax=Pedobacter sp. KBS0701 TaxID=2578106 RepID=UPI00110D40CA|nr:hypothetical protein [Pedobacter sp. KBS0701]QDW25192.1 hypothetical protein FFJ24_010365 [Pedobacter sp. KBS0701]
MFVRFDHLLGIEIVLLQEGQYRCSYAVVYRKGNAMEILEHKELEGSLVKVLESLPRKYPVALALSGKGILHKQVERKGDGQSGLFREAFPSVEKKEFYVQEFVQEKQAWISIVRKSLADDLSGKLRSAGLKIYTLSLGGLPIVGIWNLLGETNAGFSVDGHVFSVAGDGSFSGYGNTESRPGKSKVALGGNQVASQSVLPYALAFQLFLHDRVERVKADNKEVDLAFGAFLEDSGLKKMASVFIFVLLGLLLISFFTLSHYNAENAVLNEKAGHLTATADQGDVLKKEIALQKAQLKKMGWNGGYSYAFLLNEIGSSRPRLLNLTQVQFGEEKKTGYVEQAGNTIKISGETANLSAVNNWIFMLKEKKWVRSVRLLRYQQDMGSESYSFNLLIGY